MEIFELLLIVLGLFAVLVISINLITKVAVYYRTRFGFSIWSGVLILFVALSLFALIENDSSNKHVLLSFLSIALVVLCLVQDIRLSGVSYGLLGFVFQIAMTLVALFLLILLLACFLGRIITRQTRKMSNSLFGVTEEIRYAIILFPVFVRI